MKNMPYSVIHNNKDIGVACSNEEAQEIAGGFSVVLIKEKRPENIARFDEKSNLGFRAYYVLCDSSDFNKTTLSKNLNDLVSRQTSVSDLETKKSSEDFFEMSTWTLKELLLESYKLNKEDL
jgi:hypothetical protein